MNLDLLPCGICDCSLCECLLQSFTQPSHLQAQNV